MANWQGFACRPVYIRFRKCWQRELCAVAASILQRAEHAALGLRGEHHARLCWLWPNPPPRRKYYSVIRRTHRPRLQTARLTNSLSLIFSHKDLLCRVFICCLFARTYTTLFTEWWTSLRNYVSQQKKRHSSRLCDVDKWFIQQEWWTICQYFLFFYRRQSSTINNSAVIKQFLGQWASENVSQNRECLANSHVDYFRWQTDISRTTPSNLKLIAVALLRWMLLSDGCPAHFWSSMTLKAVFGVPETVCEGCVVAAVQFRQGWRWWIINDLGLVHDIIMWSEALFSLKSLWFVLLIRGSGLTTVVILWASLKGFQPPGRCNLRNRPWGSNSSFTTWTVTLIIQINIQINHLMQTTVEIN